MYGGIMMKIDDCGTVRDMTPEEEQQWFADMEVENQDCEKSVTLDI